MDTSKLVIKIAKDFLADLVLSDKDKKVIDAFTDKKPMEGKKLSTDGKQLDGNWMGGNNIAHWEGDKIVERGSSSKAEEVVQRALHKNTPKNFFAAGALEIGKNYKVANDFYAYWVEGHEPVSPHSGETSTAVNLMEGNMVRIIKKRGNNWYEAKLLHPVRLTDNGKTFSHQGEVLISVMEIDNLIEA